MVTAVVLIKAETAGCRSSPDSSRSSRRERGVLGRGPVRPRALVRVRENEDLARVISEKMRRLPGITSSETLIAFKVYSKQDLEADSRSGSTDDAPGGRAAQRGGATTARPEPPQRVGLEVGEPSLHAEPDRLLDLVVEARRCSRRSSGRARRRTGTTARRVVVLDHAEQGDPPQPAAVVVGVLRHHAPAVSSSRKCACRTRGAARP